MGLVALFSITSVFLAIFFGSLAIIFGILSKGNNKKLAGKGKLGFIIGSAALACGLVIAFTVVYLIFFNSEYREYINESYKEIYGITFDEYMDAVKEVYYNDGNITPETLEKLQLQGAPAKTDILNQNSNTNTDNIYDKFTLKGMEESLW